MVKYKRLNDEQKKLAEENHGLIFKFMKLKNLDFEELYGLLAISLCKAAFLYKSNLGYSFTTYAFKCMETDYINYIKSLTEEFRIPVKYLTSFEDFFDSDDNDLDGLRALEDKKSFDNSIVELKDFVNMLSNVQRKVFYGLMYGYNEAELARLFKCSRQNVNLIKKEIGKKYLKYKGE